MISGARYSGVPHRVQVRPFTLLANPKSVTCSGERENRRPITHTHIAKFYTDPSALRPPGTTHLDVALLVDEQVLGLQVSVDEVQRVEVLEGQHDLGGIEASVWLAVRREERRRLGWR